MTSHPPDPNRNLPPDNQQSSGSDTAQPTSPDAGLDDGSATIAHRPERPTVYDQTIISKRSPDDVGIAPPLAKPLSNTEIGKRLVGTQLDEYLLEEFVGGGGMGTVFRAADQKLARTVAIKVLTARYGEDDEDARRFELEAQSAARLNHENIAHVYGIGKADGWQYIVFEFIAGQNLRDFVQATGPLSLEDVVVFSLQVAAALEHASARDLVHRDIKPSNVIITPERQAKLVDMGLARMRKVEREDEDLTASGMTLGTFDYISPEQGSDPRSADVRSDLYSLGCTMFFMLTGQPPFPAGTALQKLLNHANTPPPDIRRLRSDVPEGLIEIVDRLLAKNPAQRFQHPRDLTQGIIAFADARDLPASHRPTTRRRRQVSRGPLAKHAEWLAPALLLLFGIFVVEQARKPRLPVADQLPKFAVRGALSDDSLKSAPLRMPSPERRSRPQFNGVDHQSTIPPEPHGPPEIEKSTVAPSDVATAIGDADTIQVVSASSGRANQRTVFDSAQAAFEAMQSTPQIQRIEFATTGRFAVAPIRLENRELEIVAVAGAWPILEFRQLLANNGVWQVNGGKLVLDGVHLDFLPATEASLFHLSQVESLELRNLWITVFGSPTEPSFVAKVAEPGQRGMLTDVDELPSLIARQRVQTTAVSLTDCIVRGNVTVLHGNASQPCRLTWANGFLCTTERLAVLVGAANLSPESGQQHIDIDHVTAIMDHGLLNVLTTEENSELPAIDVNCTRSIFAVASQHSFISMHGNPNSMEQFETGFFYGGQRNFYEGVMNFWQMGDEPSQTFSDWQNHWSASESLAQYDQVRWQRGSSFRLSRESATPGDFRLADSLANPARSAAGDLERNDAGCRLAELPYPCVRIAFP